MCKYKTHVYYSFSPLLAPLLGSRDSDWCHQFCYLMFTLLIVKIFEKCVFVLRTELMVCENGPTSYIMLTIEKTAIQDSYTPLLLVFMIDIFLLISCYCFCPIWQKGQENQITKQLRDGSQTNPPGIRSSI